jgi:hypothetical protein
MKNFKMFFSRFFNRKTALPFLCHFFVLNVLLFGQAIRPITVTNELAKEDDEGSQGAQLGFPINFYGKYYDNVYVNNNGTVTLDGFMREFTPFLIEQNSRPMFAPFFADVDTRFYGNVTRYGKDIMDIGSGNVRNIFCVNWIDVGFYSSKDGNHLPCDPTILNSFQLVIIDRSDIARGDFDLEYNYDKIKWEAGTASGGDKCGLGGDSTASMGWSNGSTDNYSFPGSLQKGAFLDNGPKSLVHNRLNSTVDGRYVFMVRNGIVRIKNFLKDTTFNISTLGEPGDVVGEIRAPLVHDPRFRQVENAGDFIVDSLGKLTVSPTANLDKDTRFNCRCLYPDCIHEPERRNVTVIGHYINGIDTLYDTAVISVAIIHVSACDDLILNQNFSIRENSGPGTIVGTVALNVPVEVVSLSALGSLPPEFILNSATRTIVVATGAKLSYKTTPVYTLKLFAQVRESKVDTAMVSISLIQNRPPRLQIAADTTIMETDFLQLPITATDSDDTLVRISGSPGLPDGSWLVDSGNGRGTFFWPTWCDDHGTDTVVIRAFDGIDSVFCHSIIHVTDVNYPPRFLDTGICRVVSGKVFSYKVRTNDCDGPAKLAAFNLPNGAQFKDSGNGIGRLSWAPRSGDTGTYRVVFEATDRENALTVRDTIVFVVGDSALLNVPATSVRPAGNLRFEIRLDKSRVSIVVPFAQKASCRTVRLFTIDGRYQRYRGATGFSDDGVWTLLTHDLPAKVYFLKVYNDRCQVVYSASFVPVY